MPAGGEGAGQLAWRGRAPEQLISVVYTLKNCIHVCYLVGIVSLLKR